MSIIFAILGTIILLLVIYEIMWTTLSASEAGTMTLLIARFYKKISRFVRRKNGKQYILRSLGMFTVITSIFLWYLLLWFGWWLVFTSVDGSVISSGDGHVADYVEKFYYVGYIFFTAGLGDYKPIGYTFQILTAIANFVGIFLVAVTVSYLLNATDAVTKQRHLAGQISALGKSPVDIIMNAWDGKSIRIMENHLFDISRDVILCTQYLTRFPLIFNFHSTEILYSPAIKVAVLDEFITLTECCLVKNVRLSPFTVQHVRKAVEQYLWALKYVGVSYKDLENCETPELEPLHNLTKVGIPILDERECRQNMNKINIVQRRKKLCKMVNEWAHSWKDVIQGEHLKNDYDFQEYSNARV